MKNITVIASAVNPVGVHNWPRSSPTMNNVKIIVQGSSGGQPIGIFNADDSNPLMNNIIITVTGGFYNFGIRNSNSSPTLINVTVTASGGVFSYGIDNYNFYGEMRNVVAIASKAAYLNCGVYNMNSSPKIDKLTSMGLGGTQPIGMYNYGSLVTIDHSIIRGGCYSIYNDPGAISTVYIGASKLIGPVSTGGNYHCVGVYNGIYTPLNSTCQ